jgi:hypothetical protein
VNEPPVLTLRAAEDADIPAAATLLVRARLAGGTDGRLPGSATTTSVSGVPGFSDILATTLALGRVDLITHGATITGVACWIGHPAPGCDLSPAATPGLARGSSDYDLLNRLSMLDDMLGVPADAPHQHLACLAVWPGHHARDITAQLLRSAQDIADRDGHTLYTEIHDDIDHKRFHREGWHCRCLSLGTDDQPLSFVMARTSNPPDPQTRR